MSDNSKIEWTNATWNVITGCSVVSAGCKHCYAQTLAGTRLRNHPSRVGLTQETAAGPVWTGEVRFNEDVLKQPLHWKRGRLIFPCAHGDLFHESVPDAWIERVYAVMAMTPQHTYQVVTKRPERMLNLYMKWSLVNGSGIADAAFAMKGTIGKDGERLWPPKNWPKWPLPNVWLGVSAEHQKAANERIHNLLRTPAPVHFVSLEPLLDSIDIGEACAKLRWRDPDGIERCGLPRNLDWVIVGGESGTNARPMHPEWAMSLRDQCRRAGIRYFFKQWGSWVPMMGHAQGVETKPVKHIFPDGTIMGLAKTKKAAGRLLEGRVWDEMPDHVTVQ